MESLFLDEGFGTLDSEILDAALNALERLRLSGRTIGVISHIKQLTRCIPVRIDVKRTGVGTSTIHVKGWDGKNYMQAAAMVISRCGRECTIAVEINICGTGG